MTAGARPGLLHLFQDFRDRVEFLSVYIREAHPGERIPHHTSGNQKFRRAREWAEEQGIPWRVAVDVLHGTTHKAYGCLPNSAYLIDRTGHVAYRTLWAGQESVLRESLRKLVENEDEGRYQVTLGEDEKLLIPLIHGAAEFGQVISRAGPKAEEDFRREMGEMQWVLQKLLSFLEPLIHPGEKTA